MYAGTGVTASLVTKFSTLATECNHFMTLQTHHSDIIAWYLITYHNMALSCGDFSNKVLLQHLHMNVSSTYSKQPATVRYR